MPRVALSVALLFLATSGFAQSKKAGALNDEGKDLYADKKDYEGAAALDKLLGDLALEPCDQVFAHQPKPELPQKTGEKGADIRKNTKTAEAGPATGPETGTGQTPPPPTPPQPVPPTAVLATMVIRATPHGNRGGGSPCSATSGVREDGA